MTTRHPVIEQDLRDIVSARLDWHRFRGKTVLISGASGCLPAYMVETLLYLNETAACGCKVIGLVRSMAKARARFAAYNGRADLQFIEADVGVPLALTERCDYIIHAASHASPKFYGVDPVGTMTANILGIWNLLNHARKYGCDGFLFFSSGEVYGQVLADKVPTRESDYGYIDITNSRSCYAESKRAGETLAVCYAKQFNVPCTIIRPYHTYGPGMALDDGRVYADFVRDVVSRRDVSLHGDGKAIRAFCYLSDAVSGFFTVLLKGELGQAYNVGNPSAAISIGNLASLVVGLYPELGLKVNQLGQPPKGYLTSPISVNSPNIDRITQLGWKPHYTLQEGFGRTIRYFLEC